MPIFVGDWAPANAPVKLPNLESTLVLNLEGPFLGTGTPRRFECAPKAGPSLHHSALPPPTQPCIFALANNHTMDYGFPGLDATTQELRKRGFSWAGAGLQLAEARRPVIVEVDRRTTIGFISCCEAQFGVASMTNGGVAERGPWIYEAISRIKDEADFVVISVHGGIEDTPWPTPYLVDLYRSYIQAGAHIVHGHHSHMPQSFESYGGGAIFYGMGNFVVDPSVWQGYRNATWSLGATVEFGSTLRWSPTTFELRQEPGGATIRVEESNGEEKRSHQDYFAICNKPLEDPHRLEAISQEVAIRCYIHYGAGYVNLPLPTSGGGRYQPLREVFNSIKRGLNRRSSSTANQELLVKYHVFACESHHAMIRTALGLLAGELEDIRTPDVSEIVDKMMPWSVAAGRVANWES